MSRIPRPSLDLLMVVALASLPVIPGFMEAVNTNLPINLGSRITELMILAILALGLNVVVGYTGILHIGIGAFFGIGAYAAGILTINSLPFRFGLIEALIAATFASALVGVLLGAPTLRLRGDYLALVTLGFGEVMRFTLLNLEEITNGSKGIGPLPTPKLPGFDGVNWTGDYRYFYYLSLFFLAGTLLLLRNLEKSPLGRAWVAMREDELASTCMGLNPARLKLAAFALGAGLAGFAGCMYAVKLQTTADPNAYNFNRSVLILCCLILGGLGNRAGVLLGVFIIIGYDAILAPTADSLIQQHVAGTQVKDVYTFNFWKMMFFGLALILVMRFRPEGLLPSSRVRAELHQGDEPDVTGDTVANETEPGPTEKAEQADKPPETKQDGGK